MSRPFARTGTGRLPGARLPCLTPAPQQLGIVVGGSLSKGLDVKLDPAHRHRGAGSGPLRRRARPDGAAFFLHRHRRATGRPQPAHRKSPAGHVRPFPGQRLPGHRRLWPHPRRADADAGGGRRRAEAGQDHPGPLYAGLSGQRGGGGPDLWPGGPAEATSTSASHWRWRASTWRSTCAALSSARRRLWQDRHRQDLSHAHCCWPG